MEHERRKFRVVMAVHNSATDDHRVVKSAEALQKAGYDCHVVGTLRDPFVAHEVVNGVSYHRVRLESRLVCLLVGLWPAVMRPCLGPQPQAGPPSARRALGAVLVRFPLKVVASLLYATFSALWIALAGILLSLSLFVAGAVVMAYGALAIPYFLASAVVHLVKNALTGAARRRRDAQAGGNATAAETALKVMLTVPERTRGAVSGILRRMHGLAKGSSIVQVWLRRAMGHSFFPAWYIRGRYLYSFYPKLVELAGDAYHSHEMWMLQSCVLAARSRGSKVVYDSHELEAHRNAPWSRFVRKQWVRYETAHIRHADRVITVSDGCAQELRKAYGLPEVTVLRNTPLHNGQPAQTDLRTSLGLGEDTPLIVYVGAVTYNRGVEQALAALAELPGYVFATVGPYREDVRKNLLEYARANGLEDRFFMHRKVPPKTVTDFISSADVSISPIQNACLSYYYCLPSKLFESVFAGVPVVASDFPDMRSFILDNEVGLVCDATSPGSIAASIRQAYESRHSFCSPEKIERIRKQHCFEEESKKLIALYDDLFAINSGVTDMNSPSA